MNNSKKIPVSMLVLGALVVLIPRFILPVCEYTGKPMMKCSFVAHYEMWLGAGILLASIALFWIKKNSMLIPVLLSYAIAGVAVIWIPEYVGYCKSPSMPCNYGSIPALRLVGGAIILSSIISLLLLIRRNRLNKNDLI